MKPLHEEISELASDNYLVDEDHIEADDQWMRGFMSDESYFERLKYLKSQALNLAQRTLEGPMSPDDSQANIGTWDESESA